MQTFYWENYLIEGYANQMCKLKIVYHARVSSSPTMFHPYKTGIVISKQKRKHKNAMLHP
jgi:hypothetical protein